MTTIALFGAAGKIGTRIAAALRDDPEYRTLYVEAGDAGLARLRERGLTPTPKEEAVREADVVILAVPDVLIRTVAAEIVPALKSGALVICLDPAAPQGGELPERADIAYFVVHPCHPPIVNDEVDLEAHMDFWGGKARQHIVCALLRVTEADYLKGERIARRMFAPVMNAYRVTDEVVQTIKRIIPEFERAGICLAIENHDRFKTRALAEIVERVGSDYVGICLDTANSFGALEGPDLVLQVLGPLAVNLHIKDFVIFRPEHMMGFIIEGRPVGQGRLDVPWLLQGLRDMGRDPNAILELWTPPEETLAQTIAKQDAWARASIEYLRQFVPDSAILQNSLEFCGGVNRRLRCTQASGSSAKPRRGSALSLGRRADGATVAWRKVS